MHNILHEDVLVIKKSCFHLQIASRDSTNVMMGHVSTKAMFVMDAITVWVARMNRHVVSLDTPTDMLHA